MMDFALAIAVALNTMVLAYFLVLNAGYLITTILAVSALRRHAKRAEATDISSVLTSGAPPITLIAPAYNEEATCVEATNALLSLVYPEYEVLMVNDGSNDGTLARLTDAFELELLPRAPGAELPTARVRGTYRSRRRPNLWVVDKENGGKADALNVGVNYCRTELFCALDADTLLERDALARVVRPFLEDARTMAAGGIIRIVNDSRVRLGQVEQVLLPRRPLARFQVLEYLRAFLAGRVGWDVINAMLIISGAFGLFRRSLVVELGGYAVDTVGEDMELVVRIHRHCLERKIPYRVTFVPDPVAWTECPESLRALGRQRDRWQRGLMQVLWRHRVMLLRPKYGRVGMIAFPFFFFLEGWGPLIEIAGYVSFVMAVLVGSWTPVFALAFFMAAFIFGAALSVAAVGLEELSFRRYERWSDLWRLMLFGLLEPFGYRQLSTWWRVRGLISAMRGVKAWGVMERRGFKAAALLFVLVSATAGAQEAPPWSARIGYTREEFRSDAAPWSAWETWEASGARRTRRGSVGGGALVVRRFDHSDGAGFVDLYRSFPKSYANLRVQATADPRVLPSLDVSGELYRELAKGWEGSVGYRHMAFTDTRVSLPALSLGRYAGPWYGRSRVTYALPQGGDGSVSVSALIRRQIDESSGFLEASAGTGGEAVTLGVTLSGPVVEVRRTSFVNVGARKYFTRALGIHASLSHVTFEQVPTRVGFSIAALARW